ncbi:MAG: DUF4340 domain-containing protein [Lachnospiraceae bacterium]
MDRQKKQLLIICVLFLVSLGTYFGLKAYHNSETEQEKEKTKNETVTAIKVDSKKVNAFSYQIEGTELTFEKQEDIWYYQPDHNIKIDQNSMTSMLSSVNKLTTTQKLTKGSNPDEYGFQNPQNVLTFETDQGTYTVTLGMKNEVTGQYYVKNSESDTIYLIDTDLNTTFSKTVEQVTAVETK